MVCHFTLAGWTGLWAILGAEVSFCTLNTHILTGYYVLFRLQGSFEVIFSGSGKRTQLWRTSILICTAGRQPLIVWKKYICYRWRNQWRLQQDGWEWLLPSATTQIPCSARTLLITEVILTVNHMEKFRHGVFLHKDVIKMMSRYVSHLY